MLLQLLAFAAVLAAQPAAMPERPQTPLPPFPYLSREVSFESSAGLVKLAGTLTVPKLDARAPCVILVPGAGAVDRDDAIMGHKPFLVIADYLALHGIAALRLDSRGIGGSSGNYNQSTGDELAGDLLSAVEFLKKQPEIDPRAIGLMGHSAGGIVSMIAATKSPDVRFLVLLAAPGLPDTEVLAIRVGLAGAGRGLSAVDVQRTQEAFRQARARMLRGESVPEMKSAFVEVVRQMLPPGVDAPPQALAAAVDQEIAAARTPNKGFFLSHDPRVTLSRVSCPVLAMNGAKDQNVPAKESLAAIQKALARGKNPNAKIVEIDGLNHFFQTAITGSSMEVGQIEETFSPLALDLIVSWVQSRR
jgi:pimeloyl-ACP methyl ester carboxylesterase